MALEPKNATHACSRQRGIPLAATGAVVSGQFELARVFWERTTEPLRAALVASRVCRKLAARDDGDSDDLLQQGDSFEQWAIGVLDQVSEPEVAVELLSTVSSRQIIQAQTEPLAGEAKASVAMWPWSVMDEATAADFPSRNFVAHPHCQHLLDLYFSGGNRSSAGSIPPDTSLLLIFLESTLRMFTAGLLTNFFCPLSMASDRGRHTATGEDDGDGDDDDDEWDEDYFEVLEKSTATVVKHAGGLGRKLNSWQQNWLVFWGVPKVKFVLHTCSFLLYIVLLAFTLVRRPLPVVGDEPRCAPTRVRSCTI